MNSTNNFSENSGKGQVYDSGDIAWTLSCTTLVWLMVPGIGFFYSGLARSRSALSLIILCCWSIAVVSIQWFLFGYSLALSDGSKCPFIGGVDRVLLYGLDGPNYDDGGGNRVVPEVLFCIYHSMVAGITPALVVGAVAERGRFLPTVVFMFIWSTLVYDLVAYWTWGQAGWANKLGALDFAGGTPVHVASGAAAIAYAMQLGEREGRHVLNYKPHNLVQVVLGTSLMWFGWFGFNSGNAMGANARAAMVLLVTNLSASFGGITWALVDYRKNKSFSALSFCFGAVAGLVSVTPASGFIRPASAPVFGIIGAIACRWASGLKHAIRLDDALDVVTVHGVGGLIGTLLTGIFAERGMAAWDGITCIEGGWIDGNWMQVPVQIGHCVAGGVWSFIVTYAILWIMNKIPGLKLRVDTASAKFGLDKGEIGECAYERVPPVPPGGEGSGSDPS
ncbi:ammonium transporter 1 isoform X2 [Folsomia candida]|uniref:Ammonium transporter n=1 Tax=Folsomia candida TaxID=158441 RepID=A0A226E7M6_FOLCA|nr:ammonium transporter 1 isoform X2 [Folsomia candida]XP_021953109.1 ammonium transporter 1 isoform X2 [Folsomia candida]OXA53572.1 Ammonium transporter 1 [Folsomia candida]OXA53786.1 Ammonium transporter 1 [Folsomia candida]